MSSRAWQVEAAQGLVAGRGRIVVEFFDPGASRSVPWAKRPKAAALLAAAAEPDRDFDAVVVGEFERAFAGGEACRVIATLLGFGVQLWLPEAEGPVDLDLPELPVPPSRGTATVSSMGTSSLVSEACPGVSRLTRLRPRPSASR